MLSIWVSVGEPAKQGTLLPLPPVSTRMWLPLGSWMITAESWFALAEIDRVFVPALNTHETFAAAGAAPAAIRVAARSGSVMRVMARTVAPAHVPLKAPG